MAEPNDALDALGDLVLTLTQSAETLFGRVTALEVTNQALLMSLLVHFPELIEIMEVHLSALADEGAETPSTKAAVEAFRASLAATQEVLGTCKHITAQRAEPSGPSPEPSGP